MSTIDQNARRQICQALRLLQGIPPLRVHEGVTEALLEETWFPLSDIKQCADERILADLVQRGVGWTWLAARSTSEPALEGEWADLLEEDARRSWTAAETLCRATLDRMAPQTADGTTEELIDAVHTSLASLAFSIRAKRPDRDRRSFTVWRDRNRPECLLGLWEGAAKTEALDLGLMLKANAQVTSQLESKLIDGLIAEFVEHVMTNSMTVPGFRNTREIGVIRWEVAIGTRQLAGAH